MAQQTHFTSRALKAARKPDKDVQVLYSVDPKRKAVLFIHGFSGDAVNTWSDFHLLMPQSDKCAGYDLFFYGYDGLRADMIASASLFRDFLDRLFANASQTANDNLPPAAQRKADFGYDELVIVGHSLGAVLTRRALLDATKLGLEWTSRIKLLLFAPAHKGASVRKLAMETVSAIPFLKWFAGPAQYLSPLINQLAPDSDELKSLLSETLLACAEGKNTHLIAKIVVLAEYEKVVTNQTFGNDPPGVAIPGASHTSVCKPRAAFLEPFALLEKFL